MAKTTKMRRVLLARNKNKDSAYELYTLSPVRWHVDPSVWDEGKTGSLITMFCPSIFHRMCSLRLKPGECVECEFRDPFTVAKGTKRKGVKKK